MTCNNKVRLIDILTTSDILTFDTCSVLNNGFIDLLMAEAKQIKQANKTIFIHYAVINELKKFSVNSADSRREKSLCILKVLKALKIGGVLNHIGNPYDCTMADNQLLEYAVENCVDKRITIVTQDNALIEDILKINNINSFFKNPVRTCKITQNGNIYEHFCDNGMSKLLKAFYSLQV